MAMYVTNTGTINMLSEPIKLCICILATENFITTINNSILRCTEVHSGNKPSSHQACTKYANHLTTNGRFTELTLFRLMYFCNKENQQFITFISYGLESG